jgi:hypothetical protein
VGTAGVGTGRVAFALFKKAFFFPLVLRQALDRCCFSLVNLVINHVPVVSCVYMLRAKSN